jgi:glycosyltransferase involved in cell wall biosynthesis
MKSEMKIKGKLCVGIISKNCCKTLPQVLKNVETYASYFDTYECIIVDGFSNDGTLIIAKSWVNSDPDHRFAVTQLTNRGRMENITEARNMVLDKYRSQFSPNVYLLLLDADTPNAVPLTEEMKEGFCSNFTDESVDWDGVFCNQKQKYYDLYALRDSRLEEDYQIKFRNCNWVDGSMQRALSPFEIPLNKSIGFWPVESAFGGAGLYKTTKLKYCYYDFKRIWKNPDDNNNDYIIQCCEHVVFHNQIRKEGGKLFINTRWYIGEHL